jgi:3-oxoadipate enol-lactonase
VNTIDGSVALHHELAGPADGPVLLLGSSLGTALAMWDAQIGPLSERFRVVRFDHRGHGGSPVPPGPYSIAALARDVLALLDELGIARASYAGISLGGMVGLWLAAHAPERVDRLVALCTTAHLPPPESWAERAAAVEQAGSTEPVADAVVDRWLTPEFARARPDLRAWLRAMLVASSPTGYAACCRAIGGMDLRADLRRIAAPTLVVAGEQDRSTPPEHGERIAAAIAGARLEILSPAAHIAAVERADEVTRLIAGHLSAAGPVR